MISATNKQKLSEMISEFSSVKSRVPAMGGARQIIGEIDTQSAKLQQMTEGGSAADAVVGQTRVVEDALFNAEELLEKASRFGVSVDAIQDRLTGAIQLVRAIRSDYTKD